MEGRSSLKSEPGIYVLVNTVNGHLYIGSAADVAKRLSFHASVLSGPRRHHSDYLQKAWDKYGADSFVVLVLEYCSREELREKEQAYLSNAKPEYNMVLESRGGTTKHSAETRALLTQHLRLLAADPEERRGRSERAKKQWAERRDEMLGYVLKAGLVRKPKSEALRQREGERLRAHIAAQSPEEMRRRSLLRKTVGGPNGISYPRRGNRVP